MSKETILTGDTDSNLLARIDERTQTLHNDMQEIKKKLESHYATKDDVRQVKADIVDKVSVSDFLVVRNLVYGFAGLILTAVVVGLISLVVKTIN